MPKIIAEKQAGGAYKVKGLNSKQFNMVFNKIEKEKRVNRRKAKTGVTATALSRRSVADIAKAGRKKDGSSFTPEDLKHLFDISKKYKKRRGSLQGISYIELMGDSRNIDIKRANNQSNDGLGLSGRPSLLRMEKSNTLLIKVPASDSSKHDFHRVKIRLETLEDEMMDAEPTTKGYQAAVKLACKDRISFDCDCKRHQYWYRYLATIGNYQLSPPKEFVFPKIKNPELQGVACKHVIKCVEMMQSPAWQRPIAMQVEKVAGSLRQGDDHKHYFSDEEIKQGNKNKRTEVNQEKITKEHELYLKRMEALGDKLAKNPKTQLNRIKQLSAENKKLNAKVEQQRKELSKATSDAMKLQLRSFVDGAMLAGLSKPLALAAFAKKNKLSVDAVKKLAK